MASNSNESLTASDIKSPMDQLRQQMKTFVSLKHLKCELDLTFNLLKVNSSISQTNVTSIDDNFKDIRDLAIDLTNRSTNDLNENNASISGQSSHQLLEVLPQRQEVPEVMSSDNESQNGMKCEDNNDFESKEETMDGFVDENEDLMDNKESIMRQMFDILEQKEDIDLEEDMESNETIDGSVDDNEESIDRQKLVVLDIESNETIDGSIVDNKESIMRQMFDILEEKEDIDSEEDIKPNVNIDYQSNAETIDERVDNNEDNSDSDESQSGTELDNNDNTFATRSQYSDSETDEYSCGASDEEVGDELDTDHGQQLDTHMASHSSSDHNNQRHHKTIDGKYECGFNGCDKKYKHLCSLNKHKGLHSGRTHTCDMNGCDQTFTRPDYLRSHILRKHSTKHWCQGLGCEYKTGSKSHFYVHLKSHSNERQFKCLINNCDKSFKLKPHLTGHHLKVHPNAFPDKPWLECTDNDCQYKSKCKDYLTQHMKKHSK